MDSILETYMNKFKSYLKDNPIESTMNSVRYEQSECDKVREFIECLRSSATCYYPSKERVQSSGIKCLGEDIYYKHENWILLDVCGLDQYSH